MIVPLTLALLLAGTDQAALHAAAASTCAGFPLRKTGTIHYFCDCQEGAEPGCAGHAGDDSHASTTNASDCTSSSAPCRTFAQANTTFNRMAGGDTIAFCRGGSFVQAGNTSWYNPRCAAAADMRAETNSTTCDVRDYAPSWGGAAKPILRQTQSKANLFKFSSSSSTRYGGYRFLNLDLEGGGHGCTGEGSGCTFSDSASLGYAALEVEDGASNVLVCGNTINAWCAGAIHQADHLPQSNAWDYWGNTFSNSDLDAHLGGGDNLTIDANDLVDNGSCASQKHVLYAAGTHGTELGGAGQHESVNYRVVNNVIRFVHAPCSGPAIMGHGTYDGMLYENNLLQGGSGTCWGIGVVPDSGYGSVSQYEKHLVIRRNRVEMAGWNGIYCASCPGAVIEDNVIVYPSTVASQARGISVPSDPARSQDPLTTGAIIRNNTIYIAAGAPWLYGIAAPPPGVNEGAGYVIANNVVAAGSAAAAGSHVCFYTPNAQGSYTLGNSACFQGAWGTTYDATAHVTADPLFVNPPGDLSLQPGSPLRGAGDPAYAPAVDFLGNPRPSVPSIGAYDVGGGSSSGASSNGGSSGGGSSAGGKGTRGGCGTAGGGPGPLAGLALLALVLRGRRLQP